MASTMYGTPMVSNVMPNPMGTPMMSTVMPNPMSTPVMSTVMPNPMGGSSTGVQGLPMSSALPIIVNENTPNLAEIQSFPVIVRGNGIHMHQDPVSGQRYRMDDTFHARIPEILSSRATQQKQSNSVDIYLKSLMTSESKPENLVKNTMETFVANPINSQEILDSSLGIKTIQNNENYVNVTPNRTVTISPNVNIPGVSSQQDVLKLQDSIQMAVNSRPPTETSTIQTQQNRLNFIPTQIKDTNQFGKTVQLTNQINGQDIRYDGTIKYTVNTYSGISVNSGFSQVNQPQISNLTNTYTPLGTIVSNFTLNNNYTNLPTNKFYDK